MKHVYFTSLAGGSLRNGVQKLLLLPSSDKYLLFSILLQELDLLNKFKTALLVNELGIPSLTE